jgi:DNA-binding transcriptional regulator PaaX
MNVSPKLFHSLSIVFWLDHALRSPGSYVMAGNSGGLHKLFSSLAQDAEKKKWLKIKKGRSENWKLNFKPHLERVLRGIRDPVPRWNYTWNDHWYWLLFDIPWNRSKVRHQLIRTLRSQGFGLLQGSVWVTPFEPAIYIDELEKLKTKHAVKMCILSGTAIPIDSDMEPANEAWNWDKIFAQHEEYQDALLKINADINLKNLSSIEMSFLVENRTWKELTRLDPFLPRCLWPENYPGEASWKLREKTLIHWAKASAGLTSTEPTSAEPPPS